MAEPFITTEQLQNRISQERFRQVFDDNGDGSPSTGEGSPEWQLRKDACSKVRGALGPTYSVDAMTEENTDDAEELRRIALDIAVGYIAQRHPEVMRADWKSFIDQADKDLKSIRTAKANLGTSGTPEPPANVGGLVTSGGLDGEDIPTPTFSHGTGIF